MIGKGSNLLSNVGGGALLLLIVAGLWYVFANARLVPPLERSAIGFDGLAQLLDDQEISARAFSGGSQLDTQNLGLRVLPLYSNDLYRPASGNIAERAYLTAPARFVPLWVIENKIAAAPTLIVMPKWSDGVRRSGLAHPDFLISNPDRMEQGSAVEVDGNTDTDNEGVDEPEVQQAAPEEPDGPDLGDIVEFDFEDLEFSVDSKEGVEPLALPELVLGSRDTTIAETLFSQSIGEITLRAPQYMRVPDKCRSLVGDQYRAILMECERGSDATLYWILSDPDVLNNHGLHLGDNAIAARALVDTLMSDASDMDVIIDYSTWVWSVPDSDSRDLSELLRYFAPPFAWIWLAAGLLFVLAWWRGAVRDRPILSVFGHGHSATRYTVVAAQSRLMRNTGRDGALLRVLAQQRVVTLCDLLLGRDDRATDRQARMLAFVGRRSPGLAQRLAEVLEETAAVPERLGPRTAVALLTRLETAYEEARELA